MLDTQGVNQTLAIHLETAEASDLRERIRDAKQRLAVSRDDADRKKALVSVAKVDIRTGVAKCQCPSCLITSHYIMYQERERGRRERHSFGFC